MFQDKCNHNCNCGNRLHLCCNCPMSVYNN